MKKIWIISVLTMLCWSLKGQQITQYTHFVTNYFAYNPAMAGSAPCLDLKIGYRKQWQGFEGAPSTAFANIHGNFGEKAGNFHGLGGLVETDDTGPLSFTSLHIAYAYHMKTSRRAMLSVGVSAGFYQYRVDFGGMTLADFNDPAVQGSAANFLYPQINFGLWYYKEDRFIGFSMRNLVENDVKDFGSARLRRHYEVMAGKIIDLNDDFKFKPAAQIKYVSKSKMALDMQALMEYDDKVAVGVGFRGGNGLSALIRVDMFKYITLAYAYDLTLSKIRYDGINTHEVMIGIQACPKGESQGIPCAAYQ
jgi:type IX secretion system PorP/SprF family membrane protein